MRSAALLCCLLCFAPPALASPAPIVTDILTAQVALDRLGFSPGEIDGRPGENFRRALMAFQKAHDLATSGQLDDATWKQLTTTDQNGQPLVEYVITDADLAGPFTTTIPATLRDQASLESLNYRSFLEAISERVHSSPELLKKLNPLATFEQAEHIMVPNVGASVPATTSSRATTVFVTKSTSTLTIEDAAGQVIFHAPVTSGSQHDPLPIGSWKVNGVQRNPKFHYNPDLFWDAKASDVKATIPSGPNNPVGVVWVDISKPHYGLHGTPEPGKIGHVESHGCVRLTNWDAERVASLVKPGTRVVFRR